MSDIPTDPLQLILSKLTTLKAGNDALQASIAQQEARHHKELAALRKDFEEKLAVLAQSVPPRRPDATNAESRPAPAATPASGNSSTPAIQTPPTTQTNTNF
jgi:peptidoglycan hydrolase CwlO-like protein